MVNLKPTNYILISDIDKHCDYVYGTCFSMEVVFCWMLIPLEIPSGKSYSLINRGDLPTEVIIQWKSSFNVHFFYLVQKFQHIIVIT